MSTKKNTNNGRHGYTPGGQGGRKKCPHAPKKQPSGKPAVVDFPSANPTARKLF